MSIPAGIDYQTMFADQMPGRENPADYADTHQIGDKDAPWLYWRLADGRVQLLKGGPNGLERAMRGCTPLSRYGMIQRATRGDRTLTDEFAALVERGGAIELSAQQVLGLHWHRRPDPQRDTWSHKTLWARIDMLMRQGQSEREALVTVLPQLQGVEIPEDVVCVYCPGRRAFLSRADLNKHEGIVHREDVRTREMRDSISDALRTQGSHVPDGGPGGLATVIDLLAQNLAALAAQNADTRSLVMEALQTKLAGSDEPDDDGDEPVARRRGRPPKARDGVE